MEIDSIDKSRMKLKRELGIVEGVSVILGIIIGSGIFVSPKGVLEEVISPGVSIVVWIFCGLLSTLGAFCYTELGTMIPKSGGDYTYIREAFGSLFAFIYFWDAIVIFIPTTNAIMSLTFGQYVLQPFYNCCESNTLAVQLLAAVSICFLTFINSWNVHYTARLQNMFMLAKILSLLIIVFLGFIAMQTNTAYELPLFKNGFTGASTNLSSYALAFYSGIYSFAGWNYLNFMTEELRKPHKNLPRAIFISLPLVTVIYVLVNVGYLTNLSTEQMLFSDAIAVTLANKSMGRYAWIMPVLVSASAFGGLSVHIMTSSRLCFVAARNGHFPKSIATIMSNYLTPAPALSILCILSLLYIFVGNLRMLITYTGFVETACIMLSLFGMIYLRYKKPNISRPIKINLLLPIIFCLISLFMTLVPLYEKPAEFFVGIALTLIGVPVYYILIYSSQQNTLFRKTMHKKFDSLNSFVQKLYLSVPED